jgi:hypothetical protein
MPVELFEQEERIWGPDARPRWRICRQQLLTHGFEHLGEVRTLMGTMGIAAPA